MSNHCASCGKADANLKLCKSCKLVKYCGVECQRAHRPAHKKACKEKARELFDLQLFAQPQQREDCPICMITLSYDDREFVYMPCCGKTICIGCEYSLIREQCPFCNTAMPTSSEEIIKRLSERIEKYNDPEAMKSFGSYYRDGFYGLQVDKSKAVELWKRASELGSAAGHCNLGYSYDYGEGVNINKKKAVHHYQIGAMMGSVFARFNLAGTELNNENYQRAMKHFMIAAKCGHKDSLGTVV